LQSAPGSAAGSRRDHSHETVKLSNVAIPGVNVPPLPPDFKTSQVLVPVLFWYAGPDIYYVEFHVQQAPEIG
jgi:hypothetical protein